MDPLVVFYDIHELITQHFSYQDVFSIYKVSTNWYHLVLQNSKFAMRKIRLNVKESNHDEILNVLTQKTSEINSDLLSLLDTKRKYQNIKMDVDHGWDFIDHFVRNLAGSLVDIEVSSDIFVENLKIPTLKYLKFDNPLLEGLTTCSVNLKKLSASLSGKEYWLKKESPIAIKSALKKNLELETLELGDILTDLIFEDDISTQTSFMLTSLHIELSKNNQDEAIYNHVRNFLTQQKNLKNLAITHPDSHTINWIYASMANLESIETKIHFEFNPRSFQLPASETVKCLDLDISSNWQYSMNIKYALRTFVSCSPNLELLKIRMTSPLEIDDFRFLVLNAVKLKQLVQNANDRLYIYQEIYEQMRQDHENISQHIEFLNMWTD